MLRRGAVGGRTTKDTRNGVGVPAVGEYNGSSQLQRTYVTLGLDQNLSLTASGRTYYYVPGTLGRVRQVISASEATQTRRGGTPRRGRRPHSYDYEAFGKVYGTPTENLTQPFRFTGREWNAETSLYYYRARVFNADAGRFDARDPAAFRITAQPNCYVYVMNRPLRFLDPQGREIRFSGDPADVEAANKALADAVKKAGPVIGPQLEAMMKDPRVCIIGVTRGDKGFVVDSFHQEKIDLSDIEKFPKCSEAGTQATALVHPVVEQWDKQVNKNQDYKSADSKAVKATLEMTGLLTRILEPTVKNPDGSVAIPIKWTYITPDSSGTVIQTMTVKDQNVVSVTTKVVPD